MNAHRILVCLFVSQSPLLFGQLARTWVSGNGSNANNCSINSPCLTFAGAASKTAAGGEIDALGSGDFGPLTITHALTIDGGSGIAAISTTTSCGGSGGPAAICVKAGSGNTVTLRNLSLRVPGNAGIEFVTGTYLRVENVVLAGAPTMLIGVSLSTGTATLDHVRIQNATDQAVVAENSARVSINNSTLSFDGIGVQSEQAGTVVNVDNTLLQYDTTAVYVVLGGTIRLSNATITNDVTGLSINNTGTIVSYINNRIYGNTTNGAPTLSVSQK
jgi:hypothetical protein